MTSSHRELRVCLKRCYTWTEGLVAARDDAQITGFSSRSDCSAAYKRKGSRDTRCAGAIC